MKIPLKAYFRFFSKYLKQQKKQLILLIFLLATSVGISLLNPQIIAKFIDMVIDKKPTEDLLRIAILFILLAFLQQIVVLLSTYVSQNIGWKSTNQLREDLINHCINLDMTFHKQYKEGELIERLDGDVTNLFNFFAKLFLNLINNLSLLVGIIVLLFIKDYRVGIAMLSFSLLAIFILSKFHKISVPRWINNSQKRSEFYGFIGENISSVEDIKTSGAISYTMFRFYEIIKEWLKDTKKSNMMYGYMWGITLIIFASGYGIAFGLGGYLYTAGVLSIGSVYLIISYTDLLNRPIEQIRIQLQDLQRAGASIKRIEDLFSIKSNLIDGEISLQESEPFELVFNQVYFKYDDNEHVLENISFHLNKGEVLGLLGRTGSGKTSLARIVARLYDVSGGKVLLNGINIQDIKLKNLRNKIAYVTQEVQLFAASIRNNLTFFNKNIEDQVILEAISTMGLQAWFDKFENGLDTFIDSEGSSLSGGEAQLISFIRVFLKKPNLIILDEASSRLDPITEKLMEKAFSQLLVGRTCIIIAHRLKTIERADKIIILDNGEIIELGDRFKLANDSQSKFYNLIKIGIEEVLA